MNRKSTENMSQYRKDLQLITNIYPIASSTFKTT